MPIAHLATRVWPALFSLFLGLPALAAEPTAKRGQFLGAMATEYPAWFKHSFLDLREDIAEASATGKRVMIIFHQDNCPYCNILVERNLSQKAIETAMRERFDVVALNMWGDREVTGLDGKAYTEKSFAAANKVQFTPTILFFDEAGRMILRLNGYLPPARFKAALDYVGQRQETAMSYRDYAAAHEPAPARGEMHREDFFRPAPFDLTRQATSGRPLAVFFEQKDCPACDELHGRVLPDAATRQVIGKFHAIQLNMWGNEPVTLPDGRRTTAREWARALDVKYAPTLVLFDPAGREVIRAEAFFKVFHVQGIFSYVESGAYKKEPSFQRYLEAKASAIRATGQDVDIWRLADEPAGQK
ncbi:thioredoxin-related protein [Sulfuritortus calidifontis]|uniref:Thioredoxin-related protein n=1 Tax=Sulfuritortus calidifontis TaxID=1914471 RepID=A0A4R3JYL2_9PROT|nr:thioredoxin fold domain-containing protein [Sulfuritortus calidifontis]TCS72736.1 thioredoxin-related protein [Sulfuritortus calidifontis]